MSEVILSSPSLSVLGGPSSVTVQVESGAPGKRGSSVFFSNGDPSVPGNLSEIPQALDLAINVSQLDPDYRYLYQYLEFDGTFSWQKMISLSPGVASFSISLDFDFQGKANVSIPVTSIIESYGVLLPLDAFVINVSIVRDSQPVAASIGSPSLVIDENDMQSLSFTVNAAQIDVNTSMITALTGRHGANCLISIGKPISDIVFPV